MKHRLRIIMAITILSIGIVIALYAVVPPAPALNNGFSRKWIATSIQPDAVLDLGKSSYYFGGYQDGRIFLGNRKTPLFVLVCSADLHDTTQHMITNLSSTVGSNCIFMEYKNNFFLNDRVTQHVYSGNINQFRVSNTDSIKVSTDLIYPLTNRSYLLRSFGYKPLRYQLSKQENGYVYTDSTTIKNGENALFTSDGLFAANDSRSLFVYSYFYKNQFLCLDSNLNLLNTVHTIDTNFTAKLHVTSLHGGKAFTVTGGLRSVNVTTCLYDSLLLIYSRLKADNQSESSYRKNNNIDIYQINKGTYLGSLSLSRYKGAEISNLQIYDKYLYIISGHYLLCYPVKQLNFLHQ